MKFLKLFGHLLFTLLLTLLTQVGGLIWLIVILISRKTKKRKRIVFPILYILFNLILIPPIASFFGREKLPWFNDNLEAKNWFYPIAFRNYVKPQLKDLLIKSSQKSGITITYLDANFPFFDDFPLLPHRSHNDGKKIDISFMYLTKTGDQTNKKPSSSGYGVYIYPNNTSTLNCLNKGYWQYDFTKHLTFGKNTDLKFDSKSSKKLIKELLSQPETQKIFIEPYLKQSLRFNNEHKIRFHGCKAVRHDDHIHLQIK